ncbi:MAG: hypothetical protein QOF03_1143 [Alphaproteobacteria bacterium]|jgi:uncharacterized MAPEG superfamily protein|nr:hypothetical protein [Alphaproteobacteria bacterium]
MTTELWLLVAAVLLGFAQIILQAQSMNMQRGYRWNAGPRDEILPPLTGVAGRLNRALRNFLESFPLFAAAVLIASAANIHNGLTLWGAWLYVLGRIVYVPLYAFGVRYVRSLVWNVAVLGIFLILSGIARGVT